MQWCFYEDICLFQVGDRVGAVRNEEGELHFYVNGVEQGCAARNVPANIFGIIDLYGQACQASIVHHSGSSEINT